MTPNLYKPASPDGFIGPARMVAFQIRKATTLCQRLHSPLKLLLYGPPGTGKSALAELVAGELAVSEWSITRLNGTQIKIEVLDNLQHKLHFKDLYSAYRLIIVDEMDAIVSNHQAQKRFLSFLDDVDRHPDTAIVGTCNSDYKQLEERLHTRFQPLRVSNASVEEIAAFLVARWQLPEAMAQQIAFGSGGNVRAAFLDATSYLQTLEAA